MGILTLQDLFFASVAALFLTAFLRAAIWYRRISKPEPVRLKREEIMLLMNRCFNLYPIDSLILSGENIKRGMLVKITTLKNRTIEGRFVGTNSDRVICLLTKNFITADAISDIAELVVLDRREELFEDYK